MIDQRHIRRRVRMVVLILTAATALAQLAAALMPHGIARDDTTILRVAWPSLLLGQATALTCRTRTMLADPFGNPESIGAETRGKLDP